MVRDASGSSAAPVRTPAAPLRTAQPPADRALTRMGIVERFLLAELLAHGDLEAWALAEIVARPPAATTLQLHALRVAGFLEAGEGGLWRIVPEHYSGIAAALARTHLPT